MAFGIEDLERDVQKFQQDIENAKAKYLAEYAEYMDIATDLENIGQKYDFLLEEVEDVEKAFPEEKDKSDTLLNVGKGFLFSAGAFASAAGISLMVREFKIRKLVQIGVLRNEIRLLAQRGSRNGIILLSNLQPNQLGLVAKRIDIVMKATKIAKFTAAIAGILSVVGTILMITSAIKKKEYLEEQKGELKKHLDDVNAYIAEANDDTKDIINIFSAYFDEFAIDVDGVFNDNQDGFLDETGKQKFDDAVSQLRKALNGSVKRMGEFNAATKLANVRINRYISQEYKGEKLTEEVVFDTELPEEVIQRLYVFKLRELGNNVQEAIELSQLPEDIVKTLYARSYLDDGKTVADTVELSGLTENEVRRVYAGKLLDDQLNTENSDDIPGIKGITERTGLSEEVILEIQLRKISNLSSDSEAELVTR